MHANGTDGGSVHASPSGKALESPPANSLTSMPQSLSVFGGDAKGTGETRIAAELAKPQSVPWPSPRNEWMPMFEMGVAVLAE